MRIRGGTWSDRSPSSCHWPHSPLPRFVVDKWAGPLATLNLRHRWYWAQHTFQLFSWLKTGFCPLLAFSTAHVFKVGAGKVALSVAPYKEVVRGQSKVRAIIGYPGRASFSTTLQGPSPGHTTLAHVQGWLEAVIFPVTQPFSLVLEMSSMWFSPRTKEK